MISQVSIKNYKSIKELDLELGRITVLIGENGCGKSNILEALALCSAAAANKLDHEFLSSRGIRVPDDARFMHSAFDAQDVSDEITISIAESKSIEAEQDSNKPEEFQCILQKADNSPYSTWTNVGEKSWGNGEERSVEFRKRREENNLAPISDEIWSMLLPLFRTVLLPVGLENFLIYSPENSALRTFETEAQIQPLGIKGEGLFKLLTVLSSDENRDRLTEIKSELTLLDWFDDFNLAAGVSTGERSINIRDKYLDESLSFFTQKSANEGFLFLLFYFTLFISRETPSFFAIDNIDASLNPKLCSHLLKELAALAKKHDKQAIVTTHNPAILDGINLNDDDQRLFVVSRNKLGHTRVKRVFKPELVEGQTPVPLSEAFLRGYLGGLPRNF